MRHVLQVSIRWPDTDGNWQDTAILPQETSGPDWPVAVEPNITIQGDGWLDGFTFDQDLLEQRLTQYIGDNGVGEWIFMAINEGQEKQGCYFIDKSDCYRLGETSIPLEHARACVIEWHLRHFIETDAELTNACSGAGNVPVPRLDTRQGLRVKKHEVTGRFELWDVQENILLASCKHEPMAEALGCLYTFPFVSLNIEGGMAQDVTIPWGLANTLKVLVVDWDNDSNDPNDIQGGVGIVTEDGKQAAACVYEPSVRHPTGSADVDRAVSAHLDQQ